MPGVQGYLADLLGGTARRAASAAHRRRRASTRLAYDEARPGPPHVGTMIWASRAALGACGRSGTDRVIHRDEEPHRAMSNIPPSRSSSPAAQRMCYGSKSRCVQARVTTFLRKSLAEGAQDVRKLEAMARKEGLLGERHRITHAKAFKRAKHSLDIKSVRAGFGPNGGWRWELACDRDGASAASPITRLPVRAERRVPVDWVEGV